jgi:hypothetical protein
VAGGEQGHVQPLAALTGFRRGDKYKLAALLKGKLALEDVVHYNRYGGTTLLSSVKQLVNLSMPWGSVGVHQRYGVSLMPQPTN